MIHLMIHVRHRLGGCLLQIQIQRFTRGWIRNQATVEFLNHGTGAMQQVAEIIGQINIDAID